jgi:16S rRNA (guanine1207-N2)-methyltransferase
MGHVCEASHTMALPPSNPAEPASGGHYFASDPQVPSAPQRVRVHLDDVQFDMDTDRGVFSHGRVDTGTELLLRKGGMTHCGSGDHVLDLGCGAGVIAMTLALRAPQATVWAVDINERAQAVCRGNARRLGCANVTVADPSEVPDEVRFTEIWSNPPIRIGKPALHALLDHWLGRLMPHGRAVLVVHKHLGADSLAAWLMGRGATVTRLASSKGYRVLELQPGRIDDDATA